MGLITVSTNYSVEKIATLTWKTGFCALVILEAVWSDALAPATVSEGKMVLDESDGYEFSTLLRTGAESARALHQGASGG